MRSKFGQNDFQLPLSDRQLLIQISRQMRFPGLLTLSLGRVAHVGPTAPSSERILIVRAPGARRDPGSLPPPFVLGCHACPH